MNEHEWNWGWWKENNEVKVKKGRKSTTGKKIKKMIIREKWRNKERSKASGTKRKRRTKKRGKKKKEWWKEHNGTIKREGEKLNKWNSEYTEFFLSIAQFVLIFWLNLSRFQFQSLVDWSDLSKSSWLCGSASSGSYCRVSRWCNWPWKANVWTFHTPAGDCFLLVHLVSCEWIQL